MAFSCKQAIRLVELSKTPMAFVSPENAFVAINDAYCRVLQAPPGLIIGKTFAEFTYEDDVKQDLAFADSLRRGEKDRYEFVKRYLQRGSTPQRPQIIWGTLAVEALWEGDTFEGFLVTFEPFVSQQVRPLSLQTVRESLEWLKSNWKMIATILAIAASLTGIGGSRLLEVLQKAQDGDGPKNPPSLSVPPVP